MLENFRIAVCGELPTACAVLRKEGVAHIDRYNDSLDLAMNLRKGVAYHLILVYAPQGEGLTEMNYPYKVNLQGEWRQIPVRMLNEPACGTALSELRSTVYTIADKLPRGHKLHLAAENNLAGYPASERNIPANKSLQLMNFTEKSI